MIDIKVMTEKDIPFAVSMTDAEKWGYTAEDFKRLIKIEPEGCFLACENGAEIGIVTSTSYEDYGFIGSLIVKNDYRGRNTGEMLMHRAMDHLHHKGVATVELDGVIPALSLYRRLGFKDKYLSLRLKREPYKDNEQAKAKETVFLPDDITRYDSAATGLSRGRLLSSYETEFNRILFTAGNYKLGGYALLRPRAGDTLAIGPLVADSDEMAGVIVKDIVKYHGHRSIVIGVPAHRQEFAAHLLRRGFKYTQPSVRMYLGSRCDYEKKIYAIFSAEKG